MEILEITEENIDTLLAGQGILIIDAWAAWCGPCRMFAPVFEKAAAAHVEHTFAKLDTETNKQLVGDLGIKHIPTLLIYREGILLYREAGSPKAETLEDLIAQVESLDMDMVRAELAARQEQVSDPESNSDDT
jgi:thioredoxin 1